MRRFTRIMLMVLVLLPALPASAQPKKSKPQAPAPAQATMESPAKTWTDPTTGMEFVWVPGGSFEMGCGRWTSDCLDHHEKPVHTVRLNGFWLGKYEVTQGQWRRVMGNNPSKFKNGDTYPVERVSWEGAKEFITRLYKMGSVKFRLPTEAEWEYAARSGGRPEKYAGGNDADAVAWFSENSGGSTHPVGTKAPNRLGLYDMSGNVFEWVEDVLENYYSSAQDNPVADGRGWARVLRGGSWDVNARDVRASYRGAGDYRDAGYYTGFRLVKKD